MSGAETIGDVLTRLSDRLAAAEAENARLAAENAALNALVLLAREQRDRLHARLDEEGVILE